jgi:hypothetical protein
MGSSGRQPDSHCAEGRATAGPCAGSGGEGSRRRGEPEDRRAVRGAEGKGSGGEGRGSRRRGERRGGEPDERGAGGEGSRRRGARRGAGCSTRPRPCRTFLAVRHFVPKTYQHTVVRIQAVLYMPARPGSVKDAPHNICRTIYDIHRVGKPRHPLPPRPVRRPRLQQVRLQPSACRPPRNCQRRPGGRYRTSEAAPVCGCSRLSTVQLAG